MEVMKFSVREWFNERKKIAVNGEIFLLFFYLFLTLNILPFEITYQCHHSMQTWLQGQLKSSKNIHRSRLNTQNSFDLNKPRNEVYSTCSFTTFFFFLSVSIFSVTLECFQWFFSFHRIYTCNFVSKYTRLATLM